MRVIFTLMLVLAAMGVNAQVTTSAISGKVTDEQNETVIGATVIAVHEPSGTQYGAVTNVDGRYTMQRYAYRRPVQTYSVLRGLSKCRLYGHHAGTGQHLYAERETDSPARNCWTK